MKKYVSLAILMAIIIGFPLTAVHAEIFNRYLQKGDRGFDVIYLQQYLNSNPETTISTSGDGSPGNETEFYGELTKQAVIKYQKKHNLGNKYGFFTIYSGALDDKTRGFINQQIDGITATTTDNSEIDDQDRLNSLYKQSKLLSNSPFIDSISPKKATNGEKITIKGRNFATSSANTIRLTYNTIQATSTDGTTLEIEVKSELQNMFNEEAEDLDEDERDNVKEKIGQIPLFITVSNSKGISNPYQIFLGIE